MTTYNFNTNPQTGKFWDGSSYQQARVGYDGNWWTQIDGKWEKVDKSRVIFQFDNPWENVYSGLEERRNKSEAYIAHCEEEKTWAEKASNLAKELKKGFKTNFDIACSGIKKAQHNLAALFPNRKQDVADLSVTKQHQAKKFQQEIALQTTNKDVADNAISQQNSVIRKNDAWYNFMCMQQGNEYTGNLSDINNQEAIARHMEESCKFDSV